MLVLKDDLESVAEKISVVPSVLRERGILLLPENVFSVETVSEMIEADDSVYLMKFLKSSKVDCVTLFDLGHQTGTYDRRGADAWLGVIWMFLENDAFPKTIEALIQWVKSRYSKRKQPTVDSASAETTIHVHLVIEDDNGRSKLKFDGPASHFEEVLAGYRKMHGKKKK